MTFTLLLLSLVMIVGFLLRAISIATPKALEPEVEPIVEMQRGRDGVYAPKKKGD